MWRWQKMGFVAIIWVLLWGCVKSPEGASPEQVRSWLVEQPNPEPTDGASHRNLVPILDVTGAE